MKSNGDSSATRKLDFSIVENLFIKPQLADPNQQRIATIIHTLSTIILLMSFTTLLLSPFLFEKFLLGFLITGAFIIAMFTVQILNRKGEIGAAAHIFVYFIWIADTTIILLSGGFHSEYLPAYITAAVMGGLILGGWSAFHFAGLSSLAYVIFYFVDVQGIIMEPLIIFNNPTLLVLFLIHIFLAAVVMILVIRKYENTYLQLLENEQSLFQTNLALKWEIESREQAEVYYKQSENRFKSAMMDSPFPTMLHAEDGEILFINTAWVEKSGYAEGSIGLIDEFTNQLFRERSSEVSIELRKLKDKELEKSEGFFPIFTKQGESKNWYFHWTVLPELPDGRCLILTIALDMTNLVNAESALRQSEENLSKLSLITNDGIWEWDLQTDQVVFDPRYFTMAGYEVDEFPDHLDEFRKRVHPDDIVHVFEQAEGHLRGEIERYEVDFRFLKKDNTWIWVMGRGKIVEQDINGNPLRFVGTHTDISVRKQAEEELIQYKQKLEILVDDRTQKLEDRISEVEKLNAAMSNILDDYQKANEKLSLVSSNLTDTNRELEAFTFIVSNDLREPLQTIKDISESMKQELPEKTGKKTIGLLKEINTNAVQMEALVNDLVSLSELSITNINYQDIDPVTLIDEVLDSFRADIKERNIVINIEDLPHCQADPVMLKTVFHNLISNGIKFTIKKRKPEITIGYQPDDPSGRVIYFVKDNGVGFSMKDHEKVYETFQRLHDQEGFNGAGIGLALAKKIIHLHGGEIWAEAKKNRGAVFFFNLKQID
jgi:PAS domain S-box-containing protein